MLPTPFSQLVIAGAGSLALRAAPTKTSVRRYLDLNLRGAVGPSHPHFPVYESGKVLCLIQDGFNL
jgi:hypothetical protein